MRLLLSVRMLHQLANQNYEIGINTASCLVTNFETKRTIWLENQIQKRT